MIKPFVVSERITKRETDSFKLYLKEVAEIPLFETPEEERICADKVVQGDKKARLELINRNLRFVVSVAKKYESENNRIEDLINEGNAGLIKAVDKFKPEMGWKFISYAIWYIRKNILDYLNRNGKLIRLPDNKIGDLSKYNKKLEMLEQRFGRNVDISELLTEYDKEITKEEIDILQDINMTRIWSLDKPLSDEENVNSLYDIIENKNIAPTDHLLINNLFEQNVKKLVDTLKPSDINILNKLYGMSGETPMTLHEIGKELGLSREAIRQKKEIALKKLKCKIKEKNLTF